MREGKAIARVVLDACFGPYSPALCYSTFSEAGSGKCNEPKAKGNSFLGFTIGQPCQGRRLFSHCDLD